MLTLEKTSVIRPVTPEDTSELVSIVEDTGVFFPKDIVALKEVLAEYHEDDMASLGHRCVAFEENGRVVGFSYHAPASMCDRTWYLWWIAVRKNTQAKGVGSQLLQFVEDAIRGANGRLMIIETSSTPQYAPTHRFYLKHAYEVGAVLKDFYADGNDLVVYRKRFQ
jgi:ribosomal protein S18 acetylase RimI-like enzyme